jgi:DNA-binding SARP family transcriptional activator
MEFRLLGALEVRDAGRRVALGAGRQRALLAILLLHANGVVASDRLVDELWGGFPPGSARKALQVYVFRLRRALGAERIRTQRSGYLLEVGPDELDVHRFERLVQEAAALRAGGEAARAAAALGEALAFWDGPALADFTYEQFAQAEIARLEELRLVALEERIDADLRAGQGADLVGELEALVAEHPYRERLRGQLMLALYRAGRQAEALAAYQQTRRLLVDELGIEPSPALQRLEAAILRQEPGLEPPAPKAPPPGPSEATREVRKTVTVAAFDIAQASGALDPEARRRLRRSLATPVSQACARHGGQMAGKMGESLVAVFGIPAVHEDDALRAARAAFEFRGHEPPVRAGIDTGEVIVGGEDGDEDLLAADVVESAVRLRDAAVGDEIILGEATCRLLRVSARVEATPSGWRLLELVPGAPLVTEGPEAPLVGREEELAQLGGILARASRERMPHLVTVLGPAGIGKSRLAREFVALTGAEAAVLTGRCLPYGEGITFWPLREILQKATGEVTREGVLALLAGADDAARVADRLAAALDLAEKSVASEEEIFWAVRRLLETLAQERPLVVVLEDLHWAEASFLELVEHVAEWARDAPLLLLCLARPELLEARPRWGGGTPNSASLRLEPLDPNESRRLIEERPGGAQLPEGTRVRLLAAGEGNPLFLEQLLALAREGAQLGEPIPIPPTIAALLAARLDRLGPGERAVLEAAAIVGKEFSPDALVELVPEEGKASAKSHIQALVRKQFVRPMRSSGGREVFGFGHVLIQQAAHRAIPKELRADLHERFATWLAASASARAGEFDEIIGYHLEQAFRCHEELGPIEEPARRLAVQAAERLRRAGHRAWIRRDVAAAANLLGRASALLEVEEPTRRQLLPTLAGALLEAGELAQSESVLAEALEAAKAADDRQLEALALCERAFFLLQMGGSSDEALAVAERVIPIFEEARDDESLARVWRLIGFAEAARGHATRARDALERGLEHARAAGDPGEEGEILARACVVLEEGPTPVSEALERLEAILVEARDDNLVAAVASIVSGFLTATEGRFDEARDLITAGRAILDDLGQPVLAVVTPSLYLGQVELLAADHTAAEVALRAGYEALERIGEEGYRSTIAAFLARALYAQGRYAEAEELTITSNEAAGVDDMVSQIGWRCVRAPVLARRGKRDEAERIAREALALADETEFLEMRADARVALAEVLGLAERPDESARALAEAAELYEAKGIVVLATRTRALLEAPR